MYFTDAHNHLHNIPRNYYNDFIQILIKKNINLGFINSALPDELASISEFITSAEKKIKSPNIIPFSALHPWFTKTDIQWEKTLSENLEKMKNLFIGETGLDRFRGSSIEKQEEIFISHIKLALDYKRPFSIHCVREWGRCLQILDSFFMENKKRRIPFIVHNFTGSIETMRRLIKLGGYISFSAKLINNENNKVLKNLKNIELNRLFIETDFPYSAVDKNGEKIFFKSGQDAGQYYSEMLINSYITAAEINKIPLEKLCGEINNNGKIFTDYAAPW